MNKTLYHETNLPQMPVTFGVDEHGDSMMVVRWGKGQKEATQVAYHEGMFADPHNRANVACALPVSDCVTRRLNIPLPSLAKAIKVLPGQFDVLLPFSLESCVYGFPLVQQKPDKSVHALGVAATMETVEAAKQAWNKKNVEPVALDHEGIALWTQSMHEQPLGEELRVVVYVGLRRTSLAVGTAEQFLGAHGSRSGAEAFTDDEAGQNALRQWRDRLLRSIRPYQQETGASLVTLYWAGPSAETWRSRLEALFAGQHDFQFQMHHEPHTFLARALARRVMFPAPMRWNFLEGALAHASVIAWRNRARMRIAWMAAAAGLVLCIANAGLGIARERADQRVQAALTEKARRLSGLPYVERGQETLLVSREIEAQLEKLDPLLRAFKPSLTLDIQTLLTQAQDVGVQFDSLTVRENQLVAQGLAPAWEPCERLVEQLRARGWDAALDRRETWATDRVAFRLTAERIL
jgi:hypothetical protein